MLSLEHTTTFSKTKIPLKPAVLPSRKFASKPHIESITVAGWFYACTFGFALRIIKLVTKTSDKRVWRTFGSVRVTYAHISFALLVLTGSISAVGVALAKNTDTPYTAYAAQEGIESIELGSSMDVGFADSAEIIFENYIRAYEPSVISESTIEARGRLLVRFLNEHDSSFALHTDTIARQPHWKLILAISFAESGMGEKCVGNNCSGVGGSNLFEYETLDHWIVSMNKLLERRYKDKTLQQMCGVYVQPCNPNWLLATNQILGELKSWGIE